MCMHTATVYEQNLVQIVHHGFPHYTEAEIHFRHTVLQVY